MMKINRLLANSIKRYLIIFLFFFVVVLCTTGCENSTGYNKQRLKEIIVPAKIEKFPADISAYVRYIEKVTLKERDSLLISEIQNILITDSNLIILDDQKKLVLYDLKGNFKKKLINTGKGIYEMIEVADIWLSRTGQLEVLDNSQKKIVKFNDEFIPVQEIFFNSNIYASPFMINKDLYVTYSGYNYYNSQEKGNKDYQLRFLDKEFKFVEGYFPIDEKIRGANALSVNRYFYQYKDSIRYFQPYVNRIFSLNGTQEPQLTYIIKYQKRL